MSAFCWYCGLKSPISALSSPDILIIYHTIYNKNLEPKEEAEPRIPLSPTPSPEPFKTPELEPDLEPEPEPEAGSNKTSSEPEPVTQQPQKKEDNCQGTDAEKGTEKVCAVTSDLFEPSELSDIHASNYLQLITDHSF